MSSTPTTTGPIPAPTNTVNPLPATPAEAAAGVGPAASGTALDLHTQTEDAAKEYKNAQKAEKAYAQKKKCMTARKEWYDCKVHFAAGVQGFREGGKCVGRVVKAGPALAMEKVKGGKGQGVKTVDSGASGESIMMEKENANKKSGNGGVKAKVMGLKEKLLAMKEKRAMEKQAKTDEKTAIATPTASGAVGATPAAEATPVVPVPVAPVAATPVPSPTQTKQEKKRMTLDQVRHRILSYRHSRFCSTSSEDDDEEVNVAPRIAENPTRRSQSARASGSGSLRGTRYSCDRRNPSRGSHPSSGAPSRANSHPNHAHISIVGEPPAITSQDTVEPPRIPNEGDHGADSRGRRDGGPPIGERDAGAGGNAESWGSWGRSTGRTVSEGGDGGGEGLKARVAVMVRGRLRGGDARAPAFPWFAAHYADESEDSSEEEKKREKKTHARMGMGMKMKMKTATATGAKESTRARMMGHFSRTNKTDAGMNYNEKRFRRPGKLATLRLRWSLFVSKVRDWASNAMGWVGVLIMDFLGRVSVMGEEIRKKIGGKKGKKEKKVRFSRRAFF
ncbi:hypothetical protein BELL_0126g00170 [Botrytis elliptica]|uniref:Uncharacterized protein n=1 Tax=Botrytis elliptica TaxID=278938 RepID=A0A4Z1JTY0_9HELO|nr:hypothetical protein EAE99_005517 [Botrytis elliptica]TGO77038.1 hypothetical protein BELL_0126g00170 [Botrytis elliptica]